MRNEPARPVFPKAPRELTSTFGSILFGRWEHSGGAQLVIFIGRSMPDVGRSAIANANFAAIHY
jgi:hypothetical protein